jgi:hydroxymethylpyrimidine pyrophosphatase-like HAD family hydrolase
MVGLMVRKNRPLSELSRKDLSKIKLIVFDVDGVLVPRGTKIKQKGNITTLETKRINDVLIGQIKKLNGLGFKINISSGRGLYMLQDMFREILPFVSLTYENGSATWYKGKIYQHVNSFEKLKDVVRKLSVVKSKNIKGFEPKTFIVTLHCNKRVKKVEDILLKEKELYHIWNKEAYDVGIKRIQTKAVGLNAFMKKLRIKKSNVLAIGDNYNDKEMLDVAGIAITADKSRLDGNFYVSLNGKYLPAKQLMDRILEVYQKNDGAPHTALTV